MKEHVLKWNPISFHKTQETSMVNGKVYTENNWIILGNIPPIEFESEDSWITKPALFFNGELFFISYIFRAGNDILEIYDRNGCYLKEEHYPFMWASLPEKEEANQIGDLLNKSYNPRGAFIRITDRF